ncbi:MAG: N-acetyl-gamma-glutamyl-phosphate reductase [Clostridiales Family XIII bacterium]|jgi:N-acetyl-gamma-glutamyl-phosphate reductase|nr:N-acetyl-gamma-glutamyl-phosphate reductase [Clostridiales Family XIII bacterium]
MRKSKHRVFIDGRAGTVGLRIESYLAGRDDIELVSIGEEERKDPDARLARIRSADVTFLCLSDEASREIVAAAPADARIIDASTAHRTAEGWAYGLPETGCGQRRLIAQSNRVAMAGCHAAGFILLVRPLVYEGIVSPGYPFTVHSITGYSGGGKRMIAEYEASAGTPATVIPGAETPGAGPETPGAGPETPGAGISGPETPGAGISGPETPGACAGPEHGAGRSPLLGAPRQYALGQRHKHLPEMVKIAGIDHPPHFSPYVADFYAGMEVTVPLHRRFLNDGFEAADIRAAYETWYRDEPFVCFAAEGADPESGFLSAGAMAGRNDMEIFVFGDEERILLVARYDNLGKGASGSGVQCLNLMLGEPEERGLV